MREAASAIAYAKPLTRPLQIKAVAGPAPRRIAATKTVVLSSQNARESGGELQLERK